MKYIYNSEQPNRIQAKFSFTDVDGNQVEGTCYNWNPYDILEGLADGYIADETLHKTNNPLMGSFNGVADITKPICITIQQYEK